MEVSVFGIDLAKSVFQVHEIDARGEVVKRSKNDASDAEAICEAVTAPLCASLG